VSEKHSILLVSTILADLIVLLGFGIAAFFAIRHLNTKVARTPVPEAPDASRPLLYLGGVLFWPLALALGMVRLGKPETVRSARVLLLIAIGHFTFAVLAAIAIVTVVAIHPPQIVLDLLPDP
jgi:hypothetical protein